MSNGFSPVFAMTHCITNGLTRLERARGFLESAVLSEQWVREMGRRALLLEAHHTTHIEGTRLTLDQSRRLLEGSPVADADPEDARELLNYREAFDFVSEYVSGGGPITEGLIREIHRRLVEGVRGGAAGPGEYRKIQNHVVNSLTGEIVYEPPPAYEVPIMMTDLVDWLRRDQQVHPVLVSGIAQFQLVHIHPFLDGNGRASRLLSTLCLYRAGYEFKRLFTISESYDRDRPAFYWAIQSVRHSGMDLTLWLEYFVEVLATQLAEVRTRGERAIRRVVLVKERGRSDRQAKALNRLVEYGSLTIKDFERLCPDVNRRSLQRDIRAMIEQGIVEEEATSPTDPGKRYVFKEG
ncbi:MAG: Fic family protein [Gemmatimonadetes bacterium]|nr:Fic family protein [Gemmatimonadota bacterium]